MADRERPGALIRLEVEYPSSQALYTDYARSISRGGVAMDAEAPLEVGWGILFDLITPDLPSPVEVSGRVAWCRPAQGGKGFTIGVRYELPEGHRRLELERAIGRVVAGHQFDATRAYPRVPLAHASRGGGDVACTLRDLSLGGALIQINDDRPLRGRIAVRQPVRLNVSVAGIGVHIDAQVVWTAERYELEGNVFLGRLGLQFQALADEAAEVVAELLRGESEPDVMALYLRRD
jgi:Tfp pilus assembly protein PilZ